MPSPAADSRPPPPWPPVTHPDTRQHSFERKGSHVTMMLDFLRALRQYKLEGVLYGAVRRRGTYRCVIHFAGSLRSVEAEIRRHVIEQPLRSQPRQVLRDFLLLCL